MPRRLRLLAAVAGLVVITMITSASAASLTASPAPAAATGQTARTVSPTVVVVSPDPAHDLYVGTGGLVIPAKHWTGTAGDRSSVAACADCQWRVSVLCTKADLAAGGCKQLHLGCPTGTTPVRIWLSHGDGVWEVVGETCQGPRPPQTLSQVGTQVRDLAEAALPPLAAAVQPASGVLVGLPAVFRTGQPARGITGADLSVIGLDVTLDSRVRWHWVYGDGVTAWTSKPGGTWPDTSVSHVYRRAGTVRGSVQAVWRAAFTVEGLGPFAVPGPLLTQQQAVAVVVRAAHARLVG
jgi:hypothetical protein